MARLNGGLMSKLKGKLAGVVFQQYEGLNVAKEYQPNVKNPSSPAQVASRAKFKAASQMVAVFQDVLLIAASNVSAYARMIRGAVVRALYRIAEWDEETKQASIEGDEFANAVNALNFNPSIPSPVLGGTTISNATISATEGDTIKYTIAALNQDGAILGTATKTITAGAAPTPILAPLTAETPTSYHVSAVAMRANEGTGNPSYGNLQYLDAVVVAYGVRAGDVLVSNMAYVGYSQS